jgi:hypothetical protein
VFALQYPRGDGECQCHKAAYRNARQASAADHLIGSGEGGCLLLEHTEQQEVWAVTNTRSKEATRAGQLSMSPFPPLLGLGPQMQQQLTK